MKRAFIVCGAEHSGNRLVAAMLVAGGCWGRGSDSQPKIDEFLSLGTDPAVEPPDQVVVISHLEEELRQWTQTFIECDYIVHFVLTARDPWVQVRSRSEAAGCDPIETTERYRLDYRAAFSLVVDYRECGFTIIPYESFFAGGSVKRFLSLFDLTLDGPLVVQGEATVVFDANEKWYAGT